MKTSFFVRPLALAFGTAAAMLPFTGTAQAGLFDFLFGGGGGGYERPAAPPSYYRPGPGYRGGGRGYQERTPLGVKVNPRRKRDRDLADGAGGKGAKPVHERRRSVAQKSIDPVKQPNWHLEDPTLRRGDIVVLKSGVMVYEGGRRPQTREDFTALNKSRLVSKAERERIEKMAPPLETAANEPNPAQGKEASLPAKPVQ